MAVAPYAFVKFRSLFVIASAENRRCRSALRSNFSSDGHVRCFVISSADRIALSTLQDR
jgi:hypothetical protein